MKISPKYKNAFTEVSVILETLVDEDYKKIPEEIIEVIEENKNIDYKYEMNDEQDLQKQPMLPETRALLFNIFRDYLATPEQKKKIIRMQNEERRKAELKKRQLYNPDVFASRRKRTNE